MTLPVTAFDTSVLVAAVLDGHESHEAAFRALDAALAEPPVIVAQHSLLESYSVLTRLPSPHRLAPEAALELLRRTLEGRATIASLPGDRPWALLGRLAGDGIAGGATYDAVIVESCLRAGAERIVTANFRQFQRIAPAELEVIDPDA